MNLINPMITQHSWDEVRDEVVAANPSLAASVDELDPTSKYPLYSVKYPYGAKILDKGAFYLPDEQGISRPITDPTTPKTLLDDLAYNGLSNPVSVILKNTAELFLEFNGRIVPFFLVRAGHVLGTWGVLDRQMTHHPRMIWDMTAGARSIFMLPKISDYVAHTRLKREQGIQGQVPRRLNDHFGIFRELANHSSVGEPWEMKVLYFGKAWFEQINDPAWQPFFYYLLNQAWQGSAFQRNQQFYQLIYSIIQERRKIPANAYIADIVRHLFSVAAGHGCCFEPAADETCGPIARIQDVYVNGAYRLKRYVPTIMVPGTVRPGDDEQILYFSSAYPTNLTFSPKSNKRPSLITEVNALRAMVNEYVDALSNQSLAEATLGLEQIASTVQFSFFHEDPKQYEGILSSDTIPQRDPRFCRALISHQNNEFPNLAEFVRGCTGIKI